MAQVANLAGQRRLGQEARHEGLVDAESLGYLAEADHATMNADEPGGIPPERVYYSFNYNTPAGRRFARL